MSFGVKIKGMGVMGWAVWFDDFMRDDMTIYMEMTWSEYILSDSVTCCFVPYILPRLAAMTFSGSVVCMIPFQSIT